MTPLPAAAQTTLQWVLISAMYGVSVYAAGHALLHKRDPRAALGWIAVCLTFPVAGPLLYFLFGINRVHSRAARLLEESEIRRLREGGRLHGGPARHEPPGAMP
ncbi:PLDc_N domain-containing protein, partial [Desulfovibrio oxamicus]